jgi:DNA-directed RNA polymerase specialized sigma24 family protein
LRYGADLTARQIAELLGERTNTIEVALHRVLARLRAELESERAAEAARRRVQIGVTQAPPDRKNLSPSFIPRNGPARTVVPKR